MYATSAVPGCLPPLCRSGCEISSSTLKNPSANFLELTRDALLENPAGQRGLQEPILISVGSGRLQDDSSSMMASCPHRDTAISISERGGVYHRLDRKHLGVAPGSPEYQFRIE